MVYYNYLSTYRLTREGYVHMEQTKLLEELTQLRQKLRDKEKRRTGKTPVICRDDSLSEMVRLMPQKASDFKSIPGVGPAFIENYAEAFLSVLRPTKSENRPRVAGDVEEILRELSKKLINVNKNNRMLHMSRLASKYAVDLFDPLGTYNPLDILFSEGGEGVVVADITGSGSKNQLTKERYRALAKLNREATREQRDRGQNDLYIGYPFVQGCLVNGEFGVRAPLCLFPVAIEHSAANITLSLDDTRDIIYNNTLLLAHFKFNSLTKPLPDCVLEEPDPDSFLQDLLQFYADNDIQITYDSNELKKFKDYPGESFPKYPRGELHLVHNVVLGKFPAYSNAIQRDFDELLAKGLVNRLVTDLVSEYGTTDFYADAADTAREINSPGKKLDIKEGDLTYINALNGAQEAVLHAVETMDELVVEGPPGTGKSQTITSLITQFADRGKTVLMVSEKKTALDVVYSRLGNLSRYAMMLDDANNKNLFYGQLEKLLLSTDANVPLNPPDLTALSEEIDTDVATLELIADKLFTPGEFGVEPYRLYLESRRVDLKNREQIKQYKTVRSMMPEELLSLSYEEVSAIHKKFANGQLTDSLDRYQLTVEKHPWFLKMKDELSGYDIIMLSDSIDDLIIKVDAWRNKSFFARLFSKRALGKRIKEEVKTYFRRGTSGAYLVRLFLEQPEAVKQSLTEYTPGYANLKPIVKSLTDNERLYLSALRKIHKICGETVVEWNEDLYNTVLFEQIQKFEMDNRTLLPRVASFDKIISSMEKAIGEKQALARSRVTGVLAGELKYITTSKRRGEIQRAVESRRRSSVSKFVKKFDFELFKAIKIWLMTPDAVSEILPQEVGLFDLLIFDEASQLYVEKSIPSIIRAKKVVIAGDHKQLRPSSLGEGRYEYDEDMLGEDGEISAALEEESLLDLARFRYPDVLLNTHYRSKYEELIDFSNYAFYKGRLFVAPNTDVPEKPPIQVHLVKDATWEGRSNVKEARQVVALIKEFFKTRKNNETLGIITFNTAQRDTIYDIIDEEAVKDPAFGKTVHAEMKRTDNGEDTSLFVKNIESVQGDERDVIMFSIGYAKNTRGKLIHNFGWLNQKGGENRLNVAISRAKKKIHIVTSFRPAELSLDDVKNEGPVILKRYLEYAFAISEGDRENAELILRSFGETFGLTPAAYETEFASKVAESLRQKGYDIDTQVGIGGYRIDIAVKKNGRYVLGLECDGKLYATPASARERDYHRQKYLESRGWRIHRIWSMDWWRDPDAQIEKICRVIEEV